MDRIKKCESKINPDNNEVSYKDLAPQLPDTRNLVLIWNFMKSNAIFMKFHTRLQSTDFVVVLVPRPYKILIYEDEHEDEKNQIRSHAFALRLFLFFRIPHSAFQLPNSWHPKPETYNIVLFDQTVLSVLYVLYVLSVL
jgi:hypothetical protein